MNYLKTGIACVSEFFGNVPEHSLSQVADQQSPMPNISAAEIALVASISPVIERNTTRAARVKAQAQINGNVKRQLLKGDYKSDPFEIPDDASEVQELSPPKSIEPNTDRDTTSSARQQNRHGLRGLGQSRRQAADEEEEEQRLMGTLFGRSSAHTDAAVVRRPTDDNMASSRKKQFVSSAYQPVDTLSQGRSKHISNNRPSDGNISVPVQRKDDRSAKQSSPAYAHEAEGSPPRKRQRTETGHRNLPHRSSNSNEDDDEDPLHDTKTMTVSERAKKPPSTSGVKPTALRRLAQPDANQMRRPVIQAEDSSFTKNATYQRRQEENRQSSRPLQSAYFTPTKKPSVTSGVSKTQKRLNGETRKSESPDVLHGDISVAASLSPSEPEEVEHRRFKLESVFCPGITKHGGPNCYVSVCAESLHICYQNEVLSKEAFFRLLYAKIIICKVEDDTEDGASVQLCLRGQVVPFNVCYLIFKSPKRCFEFTRLISEHWHQSKIFKAEPGWIQRALEKDLAKIGKAHAQSSTHVNQKPDLEPSDTRGHPITSQKKKFTRLDPSDRPPEQFSNGSKLTNPEMAAETRRKTRSRHSDGVENGKSGAFPPPQTHDVQYQIPKKTRSRTVQQIEIIDDPPREQPEPRVKGPVWDKPLTYPPTGAKKQTIEWADLKRLEDEELLNDSIVGLFLRYVQENADETQKSHVHTMSTFFYETLMRPTDGKTSRKQINYSAVSKWTKSVDIFARDFVIVPINENLHWYTLLICNLGALVDPTPIEVDDGEDEDLIEEQPSVPGNYPQEVSKDILKSDLAITKSDDDRAGSEYEAPKSARRGPRRKAPRAQRRYDVEQPVIITLDSLDTGGRSGTASMLKDYVIEEGKQKRTLTIDKARIKGMTAKDIPHQGNFYDCGIYVCLYLERFMVNPRKFVDAVLTRENSALPWPRRLSSSKIRQRFYDFLQELYRAQENGETPKVPKVGKILIHDEDYDQPEKRPVSNPRRPGEPDLERMRNGLRFAEDHYRNPGRNRIEDFKEEDQTVIGSDEPQHGDVLIDSLRDYVAHEQEAVVIDDDDKDVSISPYFAVPEVPAVSQDASMFNSPRDLAENLRDRRESIGRSKVSKQVVDLSSPVKQQDMPPDIDTERETRAASVSTEFLWGDRSYGHEIKEDIHHPDHTRQLSAKRSPTRPTRDTIVISDSQSDKGNASRQETRSAYEEKVRKANAIHDHARTQRDASIVPESHYDSDDDVEMIDGPIHSSEDLQILGSNAIHQDSRGSIDSEMLLN